MNRFLVLFLIAAALAAVVATAYVLKKRPAVAVAAAPPPALTVTTIAPATEPWPGEVAADGDLAAWQEVVVGAETGGLRITALLVDVGDQVRRGQELATLAQDTVQAELDQQAATVVEAEANLEQAKADAARTASLRGTGTLSEQQIGQYAINERTAQARLAAARAKLAAVRVQLAQTHVLAADDGVVSSRSATIGATVQVGGELFRLVRQNRVEWRAEVTAADLPRIAVGQRAVLTLPGGAGISGAVRAIDPVLDTQKRTAVVRVDLPGGQGARPGMFASGVIEVAAAAGVLTVPESAVIVRDGHSLVFTVAAGAAGTAKVAEQRVTAGRRRGGRVEIGSGLAADALVVASGGAFLTDGDTVAVAAAAAAPAPQPAAAR